MAVNFEAFLNWCESRFYDVVVHGDEIQINSIFKENDQEHKLWCNPNGGKNSVPLGVYHCWKTDKWGTLPGLIMLVDGCSFKDALEILGGNTEASWGDLYERVEDFFAKEEVKDEPKPDLELPDSTFPIGSLPTGNIFRYRAEQYLKKRKIPIDGLYVCTSGTYYNRIVIPYYDVNGKLIYYNCRAMGDEIPKYMGPPKILGIGKSDVIYMPKWPPANSKLYVMEGEFDAISLFHCKLFSAAMGGKYLSQTQLDVLRNYRPVIAVDNDQAGREALLIIGETLLENGFYPGFIRPPEGFKDWNALLEAYNEEVVKGYIEGNETPFTQDTIVMLLEQNL